MSTTNSIKLADSAAEAAWEAAGLGSFDADSEIAGEIDVDGDGEITESEITKYNATSTTSSSDDTLPYSIVDIGDMNVSSDDFDGMKNILNKCLNSFSGIKTYIQSLISKEEEMAQEITELTSEISALMADTESDTTTTTAATTETETAENSGEATTTTAITTVTTTSSKNETKLSKILEDQEKVTGLMQNSVSISTELTETSINIGKDDAAINTVLNKTGAGGSNNMAELAVAGIGLNAVEGVGISSLQAALSGAAVFSFPLFGIALGGLGLIASVFSSLFGSDDSEKKKQEVNQLAQQAMNASNIDVAMVEDLSPKNEADTVSLTDLTTKLKTEAEKLKSEKTTTDSSTESTESGPETKSESSANNDTTKNKKTT